MFIVNATKVSHSVMSDNGTIISIQPGGVSQLIIASRNLVLAAMKLGGPEQIGIVVSGSYELDLVKGISGAIPYLYTDLDEAKAKLIDPSIDYKPNLQESASQAMLSAKNSSLTEENEALKKQVSELEEKLKVANADDLRKDLQDRCDELEKANKELTADRLRLNDQLAEANEKIRVNTLNLNELRSENGTKTQEMSAQSSMIDKLSEELKNAKDDRDKAIESAQEAQKQVTSLELQLKDASTGSSISEEDKIKLEKYDQILKENLELKATLEDTKDQNDLVAKLKEENASLLKQVESKDVQIESFKSSLQEATTMIENMKSEFNTACEIFGLYKDDDGKWQQELPPAKEASAE